MDAILMSFHPEWCHLICKKVGEENGKPIYYKSMELRKSVPKKLPFKVYMYMTATKDRCDLWEYITAYQNDKGDILNGSQKVIGEFICDKVDKFEAEFSNNGGHEEICQVWLYDGEEIHSIETGNWLEDPSDCYLCDRSRLSYDEIRKYIGVKQPHDISVFYGLHISNIKIYDEPKELSDFCTRRSSKIDNCDTCINKKWWREDTAEIAKRICAPCQKDNFRKQIIRPPQSWCYVEDLDNE